MSRWSMVERESEEGDGASQPPSRWAGRRGWRRSFRLIATDAPAAPRPAPSADVPRDAKLGLASLALATLLASLGTSSANVALPTLARELHATFAEVQWTVLAYLLAMTVFLVSAGRFGDRVGRRRLLLGALAVFAAATAACAFAPGLGALIGARALQGLGAAALVALPLALLPETVAKERAGAAMGLLGTMSAVGTALGPSLGGALLASLGWRAIFWAQVPLALGTFALARRHVVESSGRADAGSHGTDRAGTLLLAATLALYALALSASRGRPMAVQAALLTAAAGGAIAFLRVEARAASPLLRLAILRDRALGAGLAASAVVATVIMATLVVGPFHLERALGLAPGLVGLALSTGPLVAAATGIPAGRLVDRLGTGRAALAGLSAMAMSAVAVAAAPRSFGVAGYLLPLVALTAGYALFQAANNTAVMARGSAAERGVLAGTLSLSRNLGLITGTALLGAVFARATGADDIARATPEAVTLGTHVTFAVAAAMLLLAAGMVANGGAGTASKSQH